MTLDRALFPLLERLGLVLRRAGARDRIFRQRLDTWPEGEKAELGRLLRKLADEALDWMKA